MPKSEVHIALSPTLLGRGEALLSGVDLTALRFKRTEDVASPHAMHSSCRNRTTRAECRVDVTMAYSAHFQCFVIGVGRCPARKRSVTNGCFEDTSRHKMRRATSAGSLPRRHIG